MHSLAFANPRVLIIDDNAAIHDDFRKAFTVARTDTKLDDMEAALFGASDAAPVAGDESQFELTSAYQGREGLDKLRAAAAKGQPFALAFVDMRMPPGWDGVETIEQLWKFDPALQVVICSAYSDYTGSDIRARLGTTDGLLILKKPFDPAEITQLAHALTRKWALHRAEQRRTEELEAQVRIRTSELEQTNIELVKEIAERTRLENALRLAHKLESIGQLAAGIAHEINTPVQFVSDNVHFLQTSFEDLNALRSRLREACLTMVSTSTDRALVMEIEEFEKSIDVGYLSETIPRAFDSTREGLTRIAKLVQATKAFAHHHDGEMSGVDLNGALLATLEIARSEYRHVAVVETELGDLPHVRCLGGEVNQVFLNLIVNAAHAVGDVVGNSGAKGTIRVRSAVIDQDVVISVEDTGCGIPEDIQRRIFDPFFTTKEVGRGTGQGLALAWSIVVERHGGTITFDTAVGRGSTFHVRIPIDGSAASAA
jgi:signal transduction histidine kinase